MLLAPLLFAVGCTQPTQPSPAIPAAGELYTFEGTWSASGTRQTLNLASNQRASTFDLTGSLLLIGNHRLGVGFQAHAIGFTHTLTRIPRRLLWTDQRADT